MGNIKLNSSAPIFSNKAVQTTPAKDKNSLPPAELNKRQAMEGCRPVEDQLSLPKEKTAGISKKIESFIDGGSQSTKGLPSKEEFIWLLKHEQQHSQQLNQGRVQLMTPEERKSFDADSLKGQDLRERIKAAINQDPKSATAQDMLSALNQQAKQLQGYVPNNKEAEAYKNQLKQLTQD